MQRKTFRTVSVISVVGMLCAVARLAYVVWLGSTGEFRTVSWPDLLGIYAMVFGMWWCGYVYLFGGPCPSALTSTSR